MKVQHAVHAGSADVGGAGPLGEDSVLLQWNAAIRVHPFDSATLRGQWLCEIPRPDGRVDRYAVPPEIVAVAREFDGRRPTSIVLAGIGGAPNGGSAAEPDRVGRGWDQHRLRRLVSGVLVPRGLLVTTAGAWAARMPPGRRSYLYVRLPLLPRGVVMPIARLGGWLYSRIGAVTALGIILASQWWFFAVAQRSHPVDIHGLAGATSLLVVLLVSIGALVHEFGHAAAAARFGCSDVRIGWGVYLYYFVFYADLSEAWRLPRRQRAILDAGGVYFQAMYIALLGAVFAFTQWMPLLYAILFTDFAIISYASPFLRFDGYWLLTDVFGIANLRAESLAALRAIPARLASSRRGAIPRSETRRFTPGAAAALLLYGLLSVVFLVWMWIGLITHFGIGFLAEYGGAALRLADATRALSTIDTLVAAFDLLWRTSALVGAVMFGWRAVTAARSGVAWGARRIARAHAALLPRRPGMGPAGP